MIDFRYHLVSLVAVFLALACGIVLGAGPLRNAIGDTIAGRSAALSAQNAQLEQQYAAAAAGEQAANNALDAAASGLLGGTLPGYRVAVVALGPVSDDVTQAVDTRLQQAGASVVSQVTLTGAWTDPGVQAFRQSLVGYLLTYLTPVPPAGTDPGVELAQALVQGLVGADATNPDVPSANASVLLQLLSTGNTPLVQLAAPVTEPADAVVLLAPGSSSATGSPAATASPTAATGSQTGQATGSAMTGQATTSQATTSQAATALTAAGLTLLQAAQTGSAGAVLAEVPGGPGPLVAGVLAAPNATSLSTVSGVEATVGQIAVPLALAQQIGGTAGHYGTGTGLQPLPPRVVAGAPNRTAAG